MSKAYTIKITGVRARIGRCGGVRFQLCDPRQRAWVTPSFRKSVNESGGWLLLDDAIFEIARSIYLAHTEQDPRVARARLRLIDTDASDPAPLEVDDILELWLEDPAPPALP